MKQNEIIAALHDIVAANQQYTTWTISTPHLVMLVERAIKAERDACAQLCDRMEEEAEGVECCKWPTPADCAHMIRKRASNAVS